MSHKVDAADEKQLSSGCAEHDAKPLAGILMEMLFQKDVLLFKPQRPLERDICGEHRKVHLAEKEELTEKEFYKPASLKEIKI